MSIVAEEWRLVPGFPNYMVSNLGGLKTRYHQKNHRLMDRWRTITIKPCRKMGRYRVRIKNDSVRQNILRYRLVLIAFVSECPPGMEACHIDGNHANDRLDNLYWGTREDNMRDKVRHGNSSKGEKANTAKLTEEQVLEIRRRRVGQKSGRSLAAEFGVSVGTIHCIVTRQNWKHI